jgi:hypothetical protein
VGDDVPPIPSAASIRLALDTTDVARTQLIVRTFLANGNAVNAGFHLQVFC